MRILTDLSELDQVIRECDAAESDDHLRQIFTTFEMKPPLAPEDPLSSEYHAHQMDLYRRTSGREYSIVNEATPFDIEECLKKPFPYSTGSCRTTGEQLIAIGYLIRQMNLTPGAKVLEFGPGWGNTTVALAQMGFDVTAVDIEPKFCTLVERRAAQVGASVRTVNDDFLWSEVVDDQFDVVMFFECFHHAADHLRLLRSLHRILKPGGRIILGGEPIDPNFPQPWGVRLDGQSLWSIRKFGWMELGFTEDYFRTALAATGWRGECYASLDVPWMKVWELSRAAEPFSFKATDARLGTQTGERTDAGIRLRGSAGYGLFGPYIRLAPGAYRVVVIFSEKASGEAVIDVAANKGTHILCQKAFNSNVGDDGAQVELTLNLQEILTDAEVRIRGLDGFTGLITKVEFVPLHESGRETEAMNQL